MNTYDVSQVNPGAYVANFKNGQIAYATVGYSKMDDPSSPRWIAPAHFVASTAAQNYWNGIESLTPLKVPNHRTLFIDLEYEEAAPEPAMLNSSQFKKFEDLGLEDIRDRQAVQMADRVIIAMGSRMRILKNRQPASLGKARGWLVVVSEQPTFATDNG